MDLFVIRGIVEELKKEIVGGFITKIYQMNRTDLLIRLRRGGEEKDLLLSTHPDFFRLHLTGKKYANPQNPPRFCTYLRKHTPIFSNMLTKTWTWPRTSRRSALPFGRFPAGRSTTRPWRSGSSRSTSSSCTRTSTPLPGPRRANPRNT